MAGKGGGAWKVAYADFVTAMMAFFLVMWITAQNKPVKESIAQYFTDPYAENAASDKAGAVNPGEHQAGQGPGRPPDPVAKDGKPGRPPKLQIFRDLDPTRSTGTMVLFAEGSSELDPQGIAQLTAIVPQLVGKPNKVELRGHASRRPLPEGSTVSDNWELSYARCKVVRDYLVDRGIKPDRIRMSQAAEFEPYTLRQEPEWQAQNSRVEITALSEHAHPLEFPREDRGGYFGISEEPETDTSSSAGHGDSHGAKHGSKSSGHGAHGTSKSGKHGSPSDSKSSHGHGAKKSNTKSHGGGHH